MSDSVEDALEGRTDLDKYGSAKRTLYALQLALNLEDIHTIASTAITDGPDDKSCDVIYVERGSGQVIIAQGYEANNVTQVAAPARKATGLHQAVSWLLAHDLDELPERLVAAAREVHDALAEGAIQQVQIWFVHNLSESSNIQSELNAMASTAMRVISHRYPNASLDAVTAVEVGRATLQDWYLGSQTPILVSDEFLIPVDGCFFETGEDWRAVCASVQATWLHDHYHEYGERIFSANVRGYLGSQRSKGNINSGIKQSAQESPQHFWAYNNGLTALVNSFEYRPAEKELYVRGLAVVNGAQTTGAVGSVPREAVARARILARFIECRDTETVRNIIRYNNRQNATESSDFRSNDKVQRRLVEEFRDLQVIGYSGGRRGGAEDVIRRPAENMISATVAAQALAAFHRSPGLAYHEKGALWESNQLYDRFFSDRTTANHILFCFSLLRAVESSKQDVAGKKDEERTDSERRLGRFFRQRGSTFLLVAALGDCAEIYLSRQIPDSFKLHFKFTVPVSVAVRSWMSIVVPALALANQTLTPVLEREGSLRREEAVSKSLGEFRALFEATSAANMPTYQAFARRVEVL